jgi:DNA repair exonuclease SbcCD ATPase subunit
MTVLRVRLRRALVIAVIGGSLVLGVATVRAAAAWTAAGAPLSVAPASVRVLTDRLAVEEVRSADLQRRLDELAAASTDLATALDAARQRIATDAETAAALRRRLDQAKARLQTLEASIARARSALAAARPPTTPLSSGGSPGEHEAESDG